MSRKSQLHNFFLRTNQAVQTIQNQSANQALIKETFAKKIWDYL